MANRIKITYLYRDGGNYKNYGEVVFDNPGGIKLSEAECVIRSKLIDGEWFDAAQWLLPDLHFADWDNELDHTWHEFESISYTNEPCNTQLPLSAYLLHISQIGH